jgi:hypothetical protein
MTILSAERRDKPVYVDSSTVSTTKAPRERGSDLKLYLGGETMDEGCRSTMLEKQNDEHFILNGPSRRQAAGARV